jgi:hypothetical protein
MKAKAIALAAGRPRIAWSAALSLAAVGLYGQAMGVRLLAAASGGLCTGHPAFALHCPACYVAAASAIGAAALIVSGIRAASGPQRP